MGIAGKSPFVSLPKFQISMQEIVDSCNPAKESKGEEGPSKVKSRSQMICGKMWVRYGYILGLLLHHRWKKVKPAENLAEYMESPRLLLGSLIPKNGVSAFYDTE